MDCNNGLEEDNWRRRTCTEDNILSYSSKVVPRLTVPLSLSFHT